MTMGSVVKLQRFVMVLMLGLCTFGTSRASLECDYYNSTECFGNPDPNCGRGENVQKTVTCEEDGPSKSHGCFVLWQRKLLNPNAIENLTLSSENVEYVEVVQFKGCFLNNKQCIGQDMCIETTSGKTNKQNTLTTFFCCCSKDHCNGEYMWRPLPTEPPKTKDKGLSPPQQNPPSIYILVLVPLGCALFLTGAFYINRRIFNKPDPLDELRNLDEENILLAKSDSQNDGLAITLLEVKASGRFGNVWKASMVGQTNFVAVKILPLRERASWKLEQEIYSLPLMSDSEFVLKFLGCRNFSTEGDSLQLWLISEYLEYGSLYDYLKGNILKWSDLLQIASTMCEGLAFLHDEIDGGAKGYKPAVAHRDFKSKNVLLRPDLTACIADFGLAHIFYPNKPIGTCHGQVGTRRYMAPEVLEGAVSFTRDNFQRIDMYACGLVLWELATRCSAQAGPVGEYKLPFEEFVGQQPIQLEEMTNIVVNQRKRPTIRSDWLTHPGLTVLSEAMREAWDQDAEARISASCIVERLIAIK